jgi:hypothetical protein
LVIWIVVLFITKPNNNNFHGIAPCSTRFWDDYYPGLTQKPIWGYEAATKLDQ